MESEGIRVCSARCKFCVKLRNKVFSQEERETKNNTCLKETLINSFGLGEDPAKLTL
jgi:hypothetical protein